MQYNFYVLTSSRNENEIRYVGVTTQKLNQRLSGHKYCATHKEKRSCPVHKWMFHEYNEGYKINISLIDTGTELDWSQKERDLIKQYKEKGFNLLNLDIGGKGVITKEKRTSGIARSIKAHEKEIYALDKDLNIKFTFRSAVEAAKFFKLKSRSSITNAINGKWTPMACNYYWVYKKDYEAGTFKIKVPTTCQEKFGKKIFRYDLNSNLIKIYPSLRAYCRTETGHSNYEAIVRAIKNKTVFLDSFWSFTPNDKFIYKEIYNYYEIDNNNRIINKFKTLKDISKLYGHQDSYWCTFIKNEKVTKWNTKIIKNSTNKI